MNALNKLKKLGIGTVQFGTKYGISNTFSRPNYKEVNNILKLATRNNILTLDTAPEYGRSETKIGKSFSKNFRIITKTAKINSFNITNIEVNYVYKTFLNSLKNLKKRKIYAILIHDFSDLLKPGSEDLVKLIKRLKREGLVKKIGISLYDIEDTEKVLNFFKPDIIQVPCNIFDQRFIKNKFIFTKYKNIEIHARSVFLLGLLLMDEKNIPRFFNPIKKKIRKLQLFLKKNNLTQYEGSLLFMFMQKRIKYFFIGINRSEELLQLIQTTKRIDKEKKLNFQQFAVNDSKFINPQEWQL